MPSRKNTQPVLPKPTEETGTKKKERPAVELEGDSIEITVPKLNVERISMKFGGVRIAIHDADIE